MSRAFGLRAEIIIHLVFLVGAALLMGGFLLLRLGERELVDQRVMVFQTVVNGLANLPSRQDVNADSLDGKLQTLLQQTGALAGLSGTELWLLKDGTLERVAVHGAVDGGLDRPRRIWSPGLATQSRIEIFYPPLWSMTEAGAAFLAKIDVPVRLRGQPVGILRSWLSLEEIAQRLQKARRFVLLYALLYVGVVLFFGVYLLNRHVVRPTGRLLDATMAIVAGNYEQRVPEAGPKEIAALAKAYNAMLAALKKSQRKTTQHIESLRRTNEELVQTREELIRSARLATVGHLAAGMAHEIGNPLTAIVGYLTMLQSEASGELQQELIQRTFGETTRIDQLVRDLLDYASPASAETEVFDALEVFEEAADILIHQGKLAPDKLEREFSDVLPPVRMVRHHLLQVFINLLLNARDACSESDAVHLAAANENGWVRFSVSDEGHGIDEELRPHIFDPFFTTKEPGKGRGLGLAVCYRVVKEAGGRIEVDSEAGKGSRFVVRLPGALKRED